ncbi:MAG: OmpH family outer membrane protein [Candidatus Margulisiibacteriota bacterium]
MKKILAAIILSGFLATMASAQGLVGMGFIDVQKVFKEYKETSKAQGELAKKEEAFKKEFDESQKKLQEAEKQGKAKEELDKMKDDLEKKLAPKREELLKTNEKLTIKLQQDIVKAVTTVAKKMGIEVVVDKQVVITGGTDLTDMVVSELNK